MIQCFASSDRRLGEESESTKREELEREHEVERERDPRRERPPRGHKRDERRRDDSDSPVDGDGHFIDAGREEEPHVEAHMVPEVSLCAVELLPLPRPLRLRGAAERGDARGGRERCGERGQMNFVILLDLTDFATLP